MLDTGTVSTLLGTSAGELTRTRPLAGKAPVERTRAAREPQADSSVPSEEASVGLTPEAVQPTHPLKRVDRVELSPRALAGRELTEEELAEVEEMEQRDREVREHEQAHLAAAGSHARGGMHLEYETGPDGKQYAVNGEVTIDTSPVPNDPDATIRKMETVRRAAMAPSNPSAQDRRVAAVAETRIQQARMEKLRQEEHDRKEPRGADVATLNSDPQLHSPEKLRSSEEAAGQLAVDVYA